MIYSIDSFLLYLSFIKFLNRFSIKFTFVTFSGVLCIPWGYKESDMTPEQQLVYC